MNFLAWNCRGIANRQTRHALKLLLPKHQVHLVFLSETHYTKRQHETLPKALGFLHIVHFDCINQSGGVALLWDDSVTLQIRKVDYFFIDVDVLSPGVGSWRFNGFSGHPETGQRHVSWDLLRSLYQPASDKWVVMGDFNEIMSSNEKSGGPLRNHLQMQAFRTVIVMTYIFINIRKIIGCSIILFSLVFNYLFYVFIKLCVVCAIIYSCMNSIYLYLISKLETRPNPPYYSPIIQPKSKSLIPAFRNQFCFGFHDKNNQTKSAI